VSKIIADYDRLEEQAYELWGEYIRAKKAPKKAAVIVGDTYGKLFVVTRVESTDSRFARFACVCDCGVLINVRGTLLNNGKKQDCGCVFKTASLNRKSIKKKQVVINECKNDVIRECKTHGSTTYRWYRHSGGTNGYCYLCKACKYQLTVDRQNRHKEALVEYKGGKCSKCGYKKYSGALDFHHVDPSTKSFALSKGSMCKSLTALKKEADKCILLCANCHREHHNMESDAVQLNG